MTRPTLGRAGSPRPTAGPTALSQPKLPDRPARRALTDARCTLPRGGALTQEAPTMDHESFRMMMSERQHEAEAALVGGDAEPRIKMWSHNDPVTVFAALGPSKAGWDVL